MHPPPPAITSAKAAATKQFLDLVVVAQEEDEESFRAVLKQEAQGQVASALEETIAKLADANPAVAMRLAKSVGQLEKGEQALDEFPLFELFQPFQDSRIKSEKLLQAALSAPLLGLS